MFELSFKFKSKDMIFFKKTKKYYVDYDCLCSNLSFLLDCDIILKDIKINLI